MIMSLVSSILLSSILALVAMAFYTLVERKLLGYFHLRKGPNKVGIAGIPQPFADAMKLFIKEQAAPTPSNNLPYMIAPCMSLSLAILMWSIYPHTNQSLYLQFSIIYFLCVSSMNVYSTFLAGWSSNSKYALLGALRGVAQTISYEVSMFLILLIILISLSIIDFSKSTFYIPTAMMWTPMFIAWFITNLAETNRAPFDFAEGESELVSGFNVEYSSGLFALIFMAEYMNILVMSLFSAILYLGFTPSPMSNSAMIMKTLILAALFVWVRASYPRMRYDHLMYLTWKSFLPAALGTLMLAISITMLMKL